MYREYFHVYSKRPIGQPMSSLEKHIQLTLCQFESFIKPQENIVGWEPEGH